MQGLSLPESYDDNITVINSSYSLLLMLAYRYGCDYNLMTPSQRLYSRMRNRTPSLRVCLRLIGQIDTIKRWAKAHIRKSLPNMEAPTIVTMSP